MDYVLVVYITIITYLGNIETTMATLPHKFSTEGNCFHAGAQIEKEVSFEAHDKPGPFKSNSTIKSRYVEGVCVKVAREKDNDREMR